MKTPLILTVAAAAALVVGCDQRQQNANRAADSEKDSIQKSVREAKSDVDKQARAQKDLLNAEARAAQAKLDAEKARAKAEATPDAQPKVDAAAQSIREAAGTAGTKAQTEIGTDRNPATATPATPANPTGDVDQKLSDQVRTAVFGGAAEAITAPSTSVQISASGGTITLKGTVKTEEEKTRIETAAKNVPGVSKVDNQLEVKAE